MKLITPETREAKASRAYRPQSYREAIREKHLAPYIPLACGHATTRDEIDFYSVWQPRRGRYWCDKHGKWTGPKPRPKPDPLPEEPMF